MEKSEVQRKVQLATSEEVFRKTGRIFVPVASSARHVHLCHSDVERLFGPGHQLTVFRMLSQPGQYACTEQVTIVGPKGQLAKVRVLGPERSATQVELSMTDARSIGIVAPVRESGDVAGSERRDAGSSAPPGRSSFPRALSSRRAICIFPRRSVRFSACGTASPSACAPRGSAPSYLKM